MAPPEHRRWMDNRVVGRSNSRISNAFFVGVEEFLEFASQLEVFKLKGKFACPCLKCKCEKLRKPDEVRTHLYEKGFMPHYYYWHKHGEKEEHPDQLAPIDQTTKDVDGASSLKRDGKSEELCSNSAEYNEILALAQAPLYDGGKETVLSAALRLLRWQSNCNISDVSLDKTIAVTKDMLPDNNRMPKNLYELRKLVWKAGHLKLDEGDDRTKLGGHNDEHEGEEDKD